MLGTWIKDSAEHNDCMIGACEGLDVNVGTSFYGVSRVSPSGRGQLLGIYILYNSIL
jgi:hypothetical protein